MRAGVTPLSVVVEADRVVFGPTFALSFQRTLRLPDDGRVHPLPAGLGPLPLTAISAEMSQLPGAWRERRGAILPLYQREALWIAFEGENWHPHAVKVGVGSVNAVTGDAFDTRLRDDPQDYLVCPPQPWLDGIQVGEGVVRQFVAMPLGSGTTIEEQLTPSEVIGGLQIAVVAPHPGIFPDTPPAREHPEAALAPDGEEESVAMGVGAGGTMAQKVYRDPFGIETWDLENLAHLHIHIVNSAQYLSLVGKEPPPSPIDARLYKALDLPWLEVYDEELAALSGSETLARVRPVVADDAPASPASGAPRPHTRRVRIRHRGTADRHQGWSAERKERGQ